MKTDNTSSFLIRFTQKIYEDESGESNVQWRGKISHVQGGDQTSFSDFDDAIQFMESKLGEMTEASVKDVPKQEKESVISKSFDMWKKMAKTTPKMVMDVIKDPKGQVTQLQEQIQERVNSVGDEISQKIELDDWKVASKADYKSLVSAIQDIAQQVKALNDKVDQLSSK